MVTAIESREQLNTLMVKGGPTAMIDFWSTTCGPCKAMAPHYEAISEHFSDEPIEFYKCNTGAHPQLAASFQIRSVPTIIMVHDGEIVDGMVGSKTSNELNKKVEWLLSTARGEGFLDRLFGRKKS